MTLLVTGGAGFIGSNFVLDWLAAGDEPVVNLDALTYAGNLHNLDALARRSRGIVFVQGDIGDRALVDRLLAEHRPRAVLHFAAESHVDRSIHGPGDVHADQRARHLLAAGGGARPTGAAWSGEAKSAFRFLHVSTDEVYGSLAPDAPAFTEQHPYEPNSPYSASKAASDHLVRAWHHTYGLPVLTTNCRNNYGPYHFPEKLIPLMIVNALAGKPLPVYGDGMQVRDWLYVERPLQRDPRACWPAAASARPTTSAAGTRSPTSRSCRPSAACSTNCAARRAGAYASLITHVTDRPGHDRRYAIDARKIRARTRLAAGGNLRHAASARRCSGTWNTPTGWPTCKAAATATGSRRTTPAADRRPGRGDEDPAVRQERPGRLGAAARARAAG